METFISTPGECSGFTAKLLDGGCGILSPEIGVSATGRIMRDEELALAAA
jgi:hypothetical protein